MGTLPYGQLVMSLYSWISMIVYIRLVCKLLKQRKSTVHFKSSYYTLFLLQFIADFYVFIFVEFIMRPRKFNYFNLFTEDMQAYALFSVSNVVISRGILSSGHVVIALNRFSVFYAPMKQEQVV
ncbi:hypothetical protein NECAME_18991 [Necator americanus]|uniref:Serpentine receptor class gamma n=1 Tax=Necator americanus TaxID=51031 RepID=W2SQZ9_NECAM|nr:hypothetical protein NECAME_18991 [Necator americanus]ETN72169.1 hypothetical protein NECAME_18991 [Necator americanus]